MRTDEPEQPVVNVFDRRAAMYGSGWVAYFWELGRLLADEVVIAPGALALDVAAGTGAVALPLAREGARVLALDVSASMLAQFPPAADGLPIARVLGSAQALPLPAASVEILTCGFGIAFFPDLAGALAEMRRVLRPAGQLALSWWRLDVPTPWVEAQRIRGMLDAESARRLRWIEELSDPARVERLVREAGFGSPRVRPLTLEWTEESAVAFREARASLWERERGVPVPAETCERLETATAGWTAPDGRLRYPLRAFAVLADGAA
jgi:ubiquinone/menaquinone biosynthesis C-methylase UbiE